MIMKITFRIFQYPFQKFIYDIEMDFYDIIVITAIVIL